MFFLIPCSFLAVWFIVQGLINLRRNRIVPRSLVKKLDDPELTGDIAKMRELISSYRSSLSGILIRILDMKTLPPPEDRQDIEAEMIDDEVSRLYHKNNQLAVIYTVSPLLGLLGTILGMMETFYTFSMSQEQSIAQLSVGINQALVTTMWGLSIAIPSFVFLYLFKQKLFYYEMNLLPGAVKKLWNILDQRQSGE